MRVETGDGALERATAASTEEADETDDPAAAHAGRRIDPWVRRGLAAGMAALLAWCWSQSIATLVAAPVLAEVVPPGMTIIPFDVKEATWPGPSRWIATGVAAVAAGLLGGVDLQARRRAAAVGGIAVAAAASALVVLHTWAVSGEFGLQFQQIRSDEASFRWFVAAIATGTVGAVVVAWVVVRWRPPVLGAPIALIGIAWAVVGSGYRRPLAQSFRPFARADGADILGTLDRAPMLLAAGLAIALIGVAVAAWPPRGETTPPAVALSSILAAGTAYVVWSSSTHVETIVASFMEGRPARRHGRATIPGYEVVDRFDGAPSGCAGEAWLRAAAAESSSVTAFTDLAAHLASIGAPPDLVERCERAAAEETRHVRCCVAVAATHGVVGRVDGIAPASGGSAGRNRVRRRRPALRRLVHESIVDGMLGEGFAAARLEAGATTAVDHRVRVTLAGIARDERSHAALAGDVVRWCATVDPILTRHEIHRTVRALDPTTVSASHLDHLDGTTRRHAGFVDTGQAERCWRDTCDAVIAELDELSATTGPGPSDARLPA